MACQFHIGSYTIFICRAIILQLPDALFHAGVNRPLKCRIEGVLNIESDSWADHMLEQTW